MKSIIARGLASFLAVAAAQAAYGQTLIPSLPAADGAASQHAPTGEVEDIVVTARKKTESLRDVPAAVTAVSGETLARSNIARLTDLVTIVPSFTVSLAANQPLTYVRGFGSAGNSSFEQSVGKFVDNVSFGRDFQGRIPIYDVERVELLKGPQVLLYGNSATAGALSIVSRKPGEDFSLDLSTSYEFVNHEVMAQGGVTVPLGTDVSLRVAGFFQDLSKGWIYNVGNGRHEPTFSNWGIRPTLRVAPAANLTLTFKAEVDRIRDRGSTAQPIRQSTIPVRQMADVTLDRRRNVNPNVAPFFTTEYAALNTELYQGDIEYDLGPATVTSTTAYSVNRQGSNAGNGSNVNTFTSSYAQRYKQFSQEIRVAGRTGALDYLVGGYFQRDTYAFYGFQLVDVSPYGLAAPRFGRFSTLDQTSRSYSLFSDLTYHVTPTFSISAGARYSIVRKSTDQSANPIDFFGGVSFDTPRSAGTTRLNPALNGTYTALLGGIPHTFFDIKTRESYLQPQILAQYRPSGRTMLYAKFVKGNKAGGVDIFYNGSVSRGANTADAQFRPEQATSFEAGIKGKTPDNRFEYGVSLFNTRFEDLQTASFVGVAILTTNAGVARARGIDVDFAWAATDTLQLRGSATLQDSKYLEYLGGSCTVLQSINATCSAATGGQNLSGHPTPFASKFLATFAVDHRSEIGNVTINPGVSIVYRSRYNTSLNDDPLGDQKGIATLDAHLDLGFGGGRWTASLFGRNLTDIAYKEYSVAAPLIPGSFLAFVSRARQVGLSLRANY